MWLWKIFFFHFCRANKVHDFIDIGSNKPVNGGRFFKSVETLVNDPKYYAFEANPHCFSYYYEYLGPNFKFYNIAIGDAIGFVEFNFPEVRKKDQMGLIRRIDTKIFGNYHRNLIKFELANDLGVSSERNESGTKKFSSPMVRLDSLFSDFTEETVLWIDVEGGLSGVLKGCGNLLESKKLCALFVEADTVVDSLKDWLNLESHKVLTDYGFKLLYVSDASNGFYVRNELDSGIFNDDDNLNKEKILQKRHNFFLRLKSLFFRGDNLMKNWEKY
jgi:FkbM family methyltransferase